MKWSLFGEILELADCYSLLIKGLFPQKKVVGCRFWSGIRQGIKIYMNDQEYL
jgi:hypothetical protein